MPETHSGLHAAISLNGAAEAKTSNKDSTNDDAAALIASAAHSLTHTSRDIHLSPTYDHANTTKINAANQGLGSNTVTLSAAARSSSSTGHVSPHHGASGNGIGAAGKPEGAGALYNV